VEEVCVVAGVFLIEIVFEKLDLSNELHKVRIESTQNGVYISVDAIDRM